MPPAPVSARASFQAHSGAARAAVFLSPGHLLTGGHAGDVALFATAGTAPSELQRLRIHTRACTDVSVLPGAGHFATAGDDGACTLVDTASACVLRHFPHAAPLTSVAASPAGAVLAAACADAHVRLYDLRAPGPALADLAFPDTPSSLAFLPDGGLATACLDGTVSVHSPRHLDAAVFRFTAGGPLAPTALVAAPVRGRVTLFALAHGAVVPLDPCGSAGLPLLVAPTLRRSRTAGRALAVGRPSDPLLLACSDVGGSLTAFGAVSGRAEHTLSPLGPAGALTCCATSGDGFCAAVGNDTGRVALLDVL
jgi:hypothetical protein